MGFFLEMEWYFKYKDAYYFAITTKKFTKANNKCVRTCTESQR